MSTAELTGVQALERKPSGLPMVPGQVERREFEYIRHGTCAFTGHSQWPSDYALPQQTAPGR